MVRELAADAHLDLMDINTVGKTADRADIVEGLPVITSEMRAGLVRLDRYRASDDGWFDVEYADGHRVTQNGERVATRFRGLSGTLVAADEWAKASATMNIAGTDVSRIITD